MLTDRVKEQASLELEGNRQKDRLRKAQLLQDFLTSTMSGRLPDQPWSKKDLRRATREAKKMRPTVHRKIDGTVVTKVRGREVMREDPRGNVMYNALKNGSPEAIAKVFGVNLVSAFGESPAQKAGAAPAAPVSRAPVSRAPVSRAPAPKAGTAPAPAQPKQGGWVDQRENPAPTRKPVYDTPWIRNGGKSFDPFDDRDVGVLVDAGSVKFDASGRKVFDYTAGMSPEARAAWAKRLDDSNAYLDGHTLLTPREMGDSGHNALGRTLYDDDGKPTSGGARSAAKGGRTRSALRWRPGR